jgi:hypothetical protein
MSHNHPPLIVTHYFPTIHTTITLTSHSRSSKWAFPNVFYFMLRQCGRTLIFKLTLVKGDLSYLNTISWRLMEIKWLFIKRLTTELHSCTFEDNSSVPKIQRSSFGNNTKTIISKSSVMVRLAYWLIALDVSWEPSFSSSTRMECYP